MEKPDTAGKTDREKAMKSLVIAKTTKLLLLSIICFVLLSACSQNKSTSPSLQGEFNHYFKDKKYSKYVQDNLNDTSHAKESRQAKSQVLANNKAQKIALKKVKNQLSSKKKNASNQLKSAVANNGLFKPGKASSQNALKQKAPLSQVLSIVLNNNLTIKNSFEEAQASLTKYDQVSFLDDMLAQYAAFTKDLSLTGSNQKHNKSVAGGFPFPGLTSLKASIIDQAVESSRLKLKQTTQDVITQTHQTYYKLQFSKQEISLIQQEIELLNALKEEIKNSYSTNTADLNSVIQVDIEIDKDSNKLQVAKDKKRAQQAKLNALMNVSPDFVLGKLDKLKAIKITATAKQLLQKAKTSRVEIALLKSELKKMKRVIRLSEKRFYPDFDAGYSRFQNKTSKQVGSGASKESFSAKPKIKASAFFAKNDSYLIETKQKYKALQFKIKSLETKTADDIQQALSNYRSQQSTYLLYKKKVLPKANEALEVAKNQYETDEAGYIQILDAQEVLLKYRLLSSKALKNMNIEASKVARLVGQKN